MVRAPGTLVISGYSTMPNITRKVTPDIKRPGESGILHVDIACRKRRLGRSALAQVYNQLGEVPPDVDDAHILIAAFDVLQSLIDVDSSSRKILAYHDISDGGMVDGVRSEMAFAGNCGLNVQIDSAGLGADTMSALFAENLGVLIEIGLQDTFAVFETIQKAGVRCNYFGRNSQRPKHHGGQRFSRLVRSGHDCPAGDLGRKRPLHWIVCRQRNPAWMRKRPAFLQGRV